MPKFIYASTKDRDLFYAVRTEISDPVFFLETENKKYLFLDYREINVFKERNKNPEIEAVLLNPLLEEAGKIEADTNLTNKLAFYLIKKFSLNSDSFDVAPSFPLAVADFLRSRGIKINPLKPFYPQRAVKTSEEIKIIRGISKRVSKVFEKIEAILEKSLIEKDGLKYSGGILTSEFLKKEAALELVKQNLIDSEGMIISSGEQSAIPHHQGSGPIKANQPIICDIFPQDRKSGYFSDMTRTYAKGNPSPELLKMYETVSAAQEQTIKAIKPGIEAKEIYQACAKIFLESGYDVCDKGFIHSLGHGLGLEVHERPALGPSSTEMLSAGNVVTIEPGLYYSEIGGVRVEDLILVAENGATVLTDHPKEFIIK